MAANNGDGEMFFPTQARSVGNKPLPPVPAGLSTGAVSLVLFYAYQDPIWTKKEHKIARSVS